MTNNFKREIIKAITAAVLKGKDDLAFSHLDDFGKVIWKEAQADAGKFAKTKHKGNFPVCYTPYKK